MILLYRKYEEQAENGKGIQQKKRTGSLLEPALKIVIFRVAEHGIPTFSFADSLHLDEVQGLTAPPGKPGGFHWQDLRIIMDTEVP